jgi:hypothetical protein
MIRRKNMKLVRPEALSDILKYHYTGSSHLRHTELHYRVDFQFAEPLRSIAEVLISDINKGRFYNTTSYRMMVFGRPSQTPTPENLSFAELAAREDQQEWLHHSPEDFSFWLYSGENPITSPFLAMASSAKEDCANRASFSLNIRKTPNLTHEYVAGIACPYLKQKDLVKVVDEIMVGHKRLQPFAPTN